MLNKNLLATVVAMAATSAGAQAQGNVTLYGLVDAYVGRVQGAVTGVNARDQKTYVSNAGGLSTSHFGIRASEDLGGGTEAIFDLSSFIRNDTGQTGRSDAIGPPVNVAADPFWSRTSFVGVRSRDWGTLRLGNMPTPLFLGSVMSNAFADSMVFSPTQLTMFVGSPLSGGTGWTDQASYDSPSWGGLSFSLAGALSEGVGGRNTGARIGYARGPVATSLAWQSVKKNPSTFADGTSPNDTKAWQLAASYDFGVAKVFAHLGRIQIDGTATAPLDIAYKLWDVSVSVPIGAGRLLAGYAARKTDDAVGPVPATLAGGNIERKVATVAYDYHLSKRTDVYAVLMRDDTVTRTLPPPGSNVGASGTSLADGARHRF
jgi:predicted porin